MTKLAKRIRSRLSAISESLKAVGSQSVAHDPQERKNLSAMMPPRFERGGDARCAPQPSCRFEFAPPDFRATTTKHHHPHSEMWLVREGNIDLTVNGKTYPLGPGSLGFARSNDEHGIRNSGNTAATYFLIAVGPGAELQT